MLFPAPECPRGTEWWTLWRVETKWQSTQLLWLRWEKWRKFPTITLPRQKSSGVCWPSTNLKRNRMSEKFNLKNSWTNWMNKHWQKIKLSCGIRWSWYREVLVETRTGFYYNNQSFVAFISASFSCEFYSIRRGRIQKVFDKADNQIADSFVKAASKTTSPVFNFLLSLENVAWCTKIASVLIATAKMESI